MNKRIQDLAIKSLSRYAVCLLRIGYWYGETKIDLDEVGYKVTAAGDSPPIAPDQVLRGVLKVLDRNRLKSIATFDRRARYALSTLSIPFGPLRLVPEISVNEVNERLTRIKTEFTGAVNNLCAQYDTILAETIDAYPQFAKAIRNHFPRDIRGKFYLEWNWLRIRPETGLDETALADILRKNTIQNFDEVVARLETLSQADGLLNTRRALDALKRSIERATVNNILGESEGLDKARGIADFAAQELAAVATDKSAVVISDAVRKLSQDRAILESGAEQLDLSSEVDRILDEQNEPKPLTSRRLEIGD